MGQQRIRIFISSPGDVAEERVLANKLVRRLADEYADRVWIEPVFWEHEPLLATDTFQSQIPRPGDCEVVVCILWSRLGTRLPPSITRPDGSRYDSGTEYEFEDAYEGFRRAGRPHLLVYRKTATPMVSLADDADLERRRAQKKALDRFIQKWFFEESDGTLKAAFHAFDDSAAFEQVLGEHLRKLVLRMLPDAAAGPRQVTPSWNHGSPFRGLEAFDFEHAAVFFGRTKAVGDALNALRNNAAAGKAFVLVTGGSGGGKSSLVRAGVLPLLTQPGVVEGVGLWRRAVLRPSEGGRDVFAALADALLRPEALPELAADGTSAGELARLIRDNPGAAFPLIKGALSLAAAESAQQQGLAAQPLAHLALLVDQLEELFTLEGVTAEDRGRFVAALDGLARSGRVWVVATLRGDFYHRCFDLRALVELQDGPGQYVLAPPSAAETGQMIRQPAESAGLSFERDPDTQATLDEVLRDAATASPENLPLLEFVLQELYGRKTPEGLLTFAAYRDLGGVEGALARRAEEVFASLPPAVQDELPRALRPLVHVGEGPAGQALTRRQTPLAVFDSRPAARQFLEAFVRARLFTAGRLPDGTAVVGVAHEALLRNWPRLGEWLEKDRDLLRVRARVGAAAARWEAEGRRTDLLLGEGKPLEEGRALVAAVGADLDEAERQFVSASAARAGRRKRLKRAAVAVLALLAVLASAAAWYANGQRRLAATQKRAADEQRLRADEQRLKAERRFNDVRDLADTFMFDIHDAIRDLAGATKAREMLVRTALKYLDGLAAEAGNDPSLQRQVAAAYQRVGDIQGGDTGGNLGDYPGAARSYRKSQAIFERLASADPSDAGAKRDLMVSCNRIGAACARAGQLADALASFSRGLDLATKLADANPADAQAKRDLAIAFNRIGGVQAQAGKLPEATEAYQKSLNGFKTLAEANPSDPRSARDLTVAYNKLGAVQLRSARLPDALASFSEALKTAKKLAEADPANAQAQRGLSVCYDSVGDVRLQLGQYPQALAVYGPSLEIAKKLSDADPADAQAKRDLSVGYNNVGKVQMLAGHPREALDAYRQGLKLAEALAASDPTDATAQRDLSVSLNRVGDVQVQCGQVKDAVESYGRALKIREKLAADSPDNPQARRDLLLSHVSLGMAHQALAEDGKAAKADRLSACRAACDSYQQALEILGRLRADGALQPSEAGTSDVIAGFRQKCLSTEASLSGSSPSKQ